MEQKKALKKIIAKIKWLRNIYKKGYNDEEIACFILEKINEKNGEKLFWRTIE